MSKDLGLIKIATILSARNEQGYVTLDWSGNHCQLTPTEARQHALNILECAEAAETDQMLVGWLKKTMKLESLAGRCRALQDMREFRERSWSDETQRMSGKSETN